MINNLTLIGRLTRDPELQKTTSGKSVTSFTLAINRSGSDGADFIPCVAWNKIAEVICQYLKKGSLMGLKGRIQTRTYENRDQKKVTVVEVIAEEIQFLEKANSQDYVPTFKSTETVEFTESDLPF